MWLLVFVFGYGNNREPIAKRISMDVRFYLSGFVMQKSQILH